MSGLYESSLLIAVLLISALCCNGQLEYAVENGDDVNTINVTADLEELNRLDQLVLSERGVLPLGRVIKVEDSSQLFSISERGAILKIVSNQAKSINLYFDDLNLDIGELIRVTSCEDRTKEIVITKTLLNHKSQFATYPIFGSLVEIEFISSTLNDYNELPFNLIGIGIVYGDTFSNEEHRGGGSCNVDIACSEANEWQEQKDAVVRLIINDGGIQFTCSGVLMNNTSGDQRRLVLSALHCLSDVTDDELETAIVTFNYEREACNSGSAPETNFLVGITRLADSNDVVEGQVNPSGSDFVLIEIEDEIPSEWNPYWAGWTSTNVASSSGVTIHHPSGGEKKISTYSSNTVSTFLGAPGSHWGVTWVSTENGHGVTEPGSSGAPLFNANGLVMGTLTGGFSACEVDGNNGPNESDYFGKLSYHWLNNPNSSDQKLKLFLDPLNAGFTSLEGSYNPVVSVSEVTTNYIPKIYPNPCTGFIEVNFPKRDEASKFKIVNQIGEVVKTGELNIDLNKIDVFNLQAGLYYIIFTKEISSNIPVRFIKK